MNPGRRAGLLVLCFVLAACAAGTAPVHMLAGGDAPVQVAQAPRAAPLPARTDVPPPQSAWYASELRAAYEAYHAGDFERAVQGYERVVGRADEPRIQVRALISLAMIRLMPSSKMHDVVAARVILEELDRRIDAAGLRYEFFGEIELLELVAKQDAALVAERAAGGRLRKELAARDALIRQLRALSVETQ
jgi:hypothetical protein